jgi:hypothetical protein
MLTCAGLRDDPRLAYTTGEKNLTAGLSMSIKRFRPPGNPDLSDGIVDFMRPGVIPMLCEVMANKNERITHRSSRFNQILAPPAF